MPLHVAAGDVAVWWNDPAATWESVPLGSGPAGPQGGSGSGWAGGGNGVARVYREPSGADRGNGRTRGRLASANMSGMVAGQIPIAATATSVTSSTATLTASFMPAYTGDVEASPAGSLRINTLPVVEFQRRHLPGHHGQRQGAGDCRCETRTTPPLPASARCRPAELATAVAITTAGAVNGTPIGATTPSTGTFSAVSTDASAGNGYTFYDRTVVSTGWQMRASAGLMSFFNNVASASVLTLSNAGNLTVAGSLAVANNANPTLAVSGGSTLVNAPGRQRLGAILQSPIHSLAPTPRRSMSTTRRVRAPSPISTRAARTTSAALWLVISAAELKQDVAPYSRGLDAVLALNPVTYRYRAGTTFAAGDVPGEPQVGLIAEEVQPHIPEMVGETTLKLGQEDRVVATLSPTDLVYVLVNAVKELSARVASLESTAGINEAIPCCRPRRIVDASVYCKGGYVPRRLQRQAARRPRQSRRAWWTWRGNPSLA